ncbi:MAG: hypothetical protein ACRD12_03920 [Acidimicrobiales bacterium]
MARKTVTTKRRRMASRLLLMGGYPVASWGSARLRSAWRTGAPQPVVAFEAGTAAVTLGLLLRRKPVLATLNGVTAAAVAVAWLSRRRRPR